MTGKQFQKNKQPRQVWLYRNVFYSRVSATAVFCLLISFMLQPFERSFAAELRVDLSNTQQSIVNLAVDSQLQSDIRDPKENIAPVMDELVPSGQAASSETLAETETNELATSSTDSETIQQSNASSSLEHDVPIIGPVNATSGTGDTAEPEPALEPVATTTEFTDAEIEELITPADEIPDEFSTENATVTATTTSNAVAVSNVYSDAMMQFNKSDCVTVEDGSFYCQVSKDETSQESDGLFAMQDIDGDLEIYVRKNGVLNQVTFNTVDDAAPYFDSSSNSIVWHRLIDDRYQIISYSIDTQEEVQLTADAVNNMEPSRSGPNIVWQRWNNENWDIVLYDGSETTFITDSGMHDIAPKIKGDLVMWNRLHPDSTQTIELYDIVTKEFTTISDTEGGAVSNPRMVLVYETEFENGDIITKGYDVETGEITPIASKAAELPDELPEPDATGETRALLPIKNPHEEEGDSIDNGFPELTPDVITTPIIIQPGDLVISSSTPPSEVILPARATTTSSDVEDFTLDLTKPAISAEEASMTIAIPAYDTSSNTRELTPENNTTDSTSTTTAREELTP